MECIRVPLGDINVLDFSLSEDVKKGLVQKGKEAVREWLKAHPVSTRRKSI